jgi:hypothetical protein
MTEKQLLTLAARVAKKFATADRIQRADIIREVVKTHKLNLSDSLILADCIVKGMYAAGKTIVIAA